MAIVAPATDKEELRTRIFDAVQDMYTEVAQCPTKEFHFPTGRRACEFVGYPPEELDAIPNEAVESFAGVGYPFRTNMIRRGDTVLDIGSGAGTDLFVSALKTGPGGRVYGLDFTQAMIEKAEANIRRSGWDNIVVLHGNAESIPLPDAGVDVVTSNGVLNLVPDKPAAFREIARVLRQGGSLQISDIALGRDISERSRSNPQLWAECIVGAVPEEQYVEMVSKAGFEEVKVVQRIDYFRGSKNESTKNVARKYRAISITVQARKQ